MKLQKRLLAMMFAALLAFGVAACDGDTTDDGTGVGTDDTTTTTDDFGDDDGLGDDGLGDDGLGDEDLGDE